MVPLTGASGLFTKLGKIGGLVAALNAHRGTTVPTLVNGLHAAFADQPRMVDGLYRQFTGYPSSAAVDLSYLASLAATTVITAVTTDVPTIASDLPSCLIELARQMTAAGQSVRASTVGATLATSASNTGTPSVVVSTIKDDGQPLQDLFAETVSLRCFSDSYTGTAPAGSERISARGMRAATTSLDPDWPAGSAISTALTAIDASLDPTGNRAGQWLNNGDFESFTGGAPTGWNLRVGAAGTQVIATNPGFTGTQALGIVGDGSTLVTLDQVLGVDTPSALAPVNRYMVNLWAAISGTPVTTGALEVALVDATGAALTDAAGSPDVVAFPLAGLMVAPAYTACSAVFRAPVIVPPGAAFRLRASVAVPQGTTLLIDRVALAEVRALYSGGPAVAVFAGATPIRTADSWAVTTTNDRAGKWQTLFDQLFGMRGIGLLLPSSASPTVPDSLIG